jgi:glutathione S-transferase
VLTLYYQMNCPYSLRVRLILAEKQVPFSRRVVTEGEEPADLVEISGGDVPVLVDDSFSVTDSTVIAEYLEDSIARPALRPPDARGRAVIRTSMRLIDNDLMAPIERLANGPPEERDALVGASVLEGLSIWENHLGDNGLLWGMEFSHADVWLVAAIERAATLGWEPAQRFTKIQVWRSRMRERASIRAERLDHEI